MQTYVYIFAIFDSYIKVSYKPLTVNRLILNDKRERKVFQFDI